MTAIDVPELVSSESVVRVVGELLAALIGFLLCCVMFQFVHGVASAFLKAELELCARRRLLSV